MNAESPREWATRLSADDVERLFHAALSDGDPRGVEAALRLMAVKDPHRARQLLDATRTALAIVGAGPANVAAGLRAEADWIEQAAGGGR